MTLIATAQLAERDAEIERLRAQVAELRSAIETVTLNNPYSITAFTPVTDDDWARLHDLVMAELGHGLDRYSAAMMVRAWDGCTATLREMIEAEVRQ